MSAGGQAIPRVERQPLVLPWRALLRWSLLLLVSAVLVMLAVQALESIRDSNRFPVRRVAVDGPLLHTDRAQLEALVTQFSGSGFYQADLDGLRRSLLRLPWVRQVAIRKVWPDQLRIHVLEHEALAVWNGTRLLSTEQVVFEPPQKQLEQVAQARLLPRISGPAGQSARVWQSHQRWQGWLSDLDLSIERTHRDQRGGWTLDLAGGPRLMLGRGDMDLRLQRWMRVQQGRSALDLARIERIDLRYTNGFAVAWKPAQPEQQG